MIPILEPNALIYIPYPRVNCLKTIPFTAAHTHIDHIWQYPPPPPREVATEKIIKSIGDEKSSWIMNLGENSCRNHESLRQKRQES